MKVTDIEIPLAEERDALYRFYEMVPGLLSWLILSMPIILTFIDPQIAAYIIVAYLLIWFFKTMSMNVRLLQGYRKLQQTMAIDWYAHAKELNDPEATFLAYPNGVEPVWHYKNLIRHMSRKGDRASLEQIEHAVIITVYVETRDVVGVTLEAVKNSNYNLKALRVYIALEARSREEVKRDAYDLVKEYKGVFKDIHVIEHPNNIPNEVQGKGGNITYAGKKINEIYSKMGVDPKNVIVTTLDADNRPHREYFAALSYAYIACPDPIHASFQPIAIFTNNIWDVPALMRVIATSNSFWNISLTLRPHMLRNFAAHSQTLKTLQDTNFWSVRTVVEDGHQFWRTYFRYNGNHVAHPILIPIYQDAVLDATLKKTLKSQFVQIRRWAWGASDIAYILHTGWRKRNKVPRFDLLTKTARIIEGHVSWATAALLIMSVAFIPLLLSPEASSNFTVNQLPQIASRIQTVAMAGLFSSMFLSILLLPPKPPHYKRHKWIFMLAQWALMPFSTIIYGSLAALNSQTRLILGKYLGKFDVTAKVVKKH